MRFEKEIAQINDFVLNNSLLLASECGVHITCNIDIYCNPIFTVRNNSTGKSMVFLNRNRLEIDEEIYLAFKEQVKLNRFLGI